LLEIDRAPFVNRQLPAGGLPASRSLALRSEQVSQRNNIWLARFLIARCNYRASIPLFESVYMLENFFATIFTALCSPL
jgi:hypothetical protein